MSISLKDMIAELRRELRNRQIIYPSLINRGALTETAADRQEARLQAALDVLVSLEELIQAVDHSEAAPVCQRQSDFALKPAV
jgi:hypothetical protein